MMQPPLPGPDPRSSLGQSHRLRLDRVEATLARLRQGDDQDPRTVRDCIDNAVGRILANLPSTAAPTEPCRRRWKTRISVLSIRQAAGRVPAALATHRNRFFRGSPTAGPTP